MNINFKDRADGDGRGSSDCDEMIQTLKLEDSKYSGTLIIDTTCTTADIAYPTDLELAAQDLAGRKSENRYLYECVCGETGASDQRGTEILFSVAV